MKEIEVICCVEEKSLRPMSISKQLHYINLSGFSLIASNGMEVLVELKFSRFTSFFPSLSSPKHFLLYVFFYFVCLRFKVVNNNAQAL